MSAAKIEEMREIYDNFTAELKDILSRVRVFKYSDFSKVDQKNRAELKKEYAKLVKLKDKKCNKVYKTLKNSEFNICKSSFADFVMELDILEFDLETAEKEIQLAQDEIKNLSSAINPLKPARKKLEIDRNQARVLFFYVARKKIKGHHEAVTEDPKNALNAIKIRKSIENSQRQQINKINKKINRLYKVVNADTTPTY